MKRTGWKALSLSLALMAFTSTTALAITITVPDTMIAFPGYEYINPGDTIGTPVVEVMNITIDEFSMLQSISIEVASRRYFDTLFLNLDVDSAAGEKWDQWEYLVRTEVSGFHDSPLDSGLYKVDPVFTYEYVPGPAGRVGHPADISLDDVTKTLIRYSTSYDGNLLTYNFSGTDFTSNFLVGDRFSVAYVPWCANDVTGYGVPEPSAFLLLGSGMIGLAVLRRKMRSPKNSC